MRLASGAPSPQVVMFYVTRAMMGDRRDPSLARGQDIIGKAFWGGGVPSIRGVADNQETGHFKMPCARGACQRRP